MEKIYAGDVVVRKNGEKYFVVSTSYKNLLHLIGLSNGNRWSDQGIVTNSNDLDEDYITVESINRAYSTFGVVSVIKDCFEEVKKPSKNKEEEPIEIDELEIERVIAHAIVQSIDGERAITTVKRISKSILDFLVEKGM